MGCFFMAKYSIKFKMDVINFCLQGNSYRHAAATFSVDNSQIHRWCIAYQHHGIEGIAPRKAKSVYSTQFKINVLTHMVNNGLSARETAAFFNIPAFTSVLEWEKAYSLNGIEGLKTRKKGRTPMTVKPKSTPKNDKDKSLQELLDEVAYLRAENDVLKKLQELREKKRRQKNER